MNDEFNKWLADKIFKCGVIDKDVISAVKDRANTDFDTELKFNKPGDDFYFPPWHCGSKSIIITR